MLFRAMEYIYVTLVTVGLIVFLIIKYFVDKRNDERRLRVQLDYEWGKEPSIEYALGKMESLAKFYQNNKDKYDIDNITWNDLDMDDLFIMLNNTKSAMGEEVLYKLLRKPLFNKLEIEQRRQLLQMIENNDEERLF